MTLPVPKMHYYLQKEHARDIILPISVTYGPRPLVLSSLSRGVRSGQLIKGSLSLTVVLCIQVCFDRTAIVYSQPVQYHKHKGMFAYLPLQEFSR